MTDSYRGKIVSEAAFARLWADPEHTLASIGDLLGICPSAVGHRAYARGLPPRRWRCNEGRRVATVESIHPMWDANVSALDIGRHFGCHQDTITKIMLRAGKVRPRRGVRMPLAEFYALDLATRMARSAAVTRAEMVLAEMVELRPGRPRKVAA